VRRSLEKCPGGLLDGASTTGRHGVRAPAGGYKPRFKRGVPGVLSNHAFGTAFDINVECNALGATPALFGQRGCVRELVPIAHKWGFFWG